MQLAASEQRHKRSQRKIHKFPFLLSVLPHSFVLGCSVDWGRWEACFNQLWSGIVSGISVSLVSSDTQGNVGRNTSRHAGIYCLECKNLTRKMLRREWNRGTSVNLIVSNRGRFTKWTLILWITTSSGSVPESSLQPPPAWVCLSIFSGARTTTDRDGKVSDSRQNSWRQQRGAALYRSLQKYSEALHKR